MIAKTEWIQPDDRAYFHQISPDCISELAEVVKALSTGKIDVETAFRKYGQILNDEIDDHEFLAFATGNINELSSYVAKGIMNIRIHRNDVDEIWFDVDEV
jgi:23S rRNA pseudoU1915 N3-methylase RlmH